MARHKKHPAMAIVASGPSLTKDKRLVPYIKKFYSHIICVSNSYELFKDEALALVSSDGRWWDEYNPSFEGDKYCLTNPSRYNLRKDEYIISNVSTQTNSGCFALIVARKIYKPTHIHLFGFDMHNKDGEHFFGPHKNLKNTEDRRFEVFKKQFEHEAEIIKKEQRFIMNCTEGSELNCFPKGGISYV